MMQRIPVPTSPLALALAAVLAFSTAACGGKPEPATGQAAATAEPAAEEGAATAEDRQAELEAREQELAAKEAELALREKEQELARREAELAAKEAAAAKAAATPKPSTTTTRPAASTSAATAKAPAAPPPPVTVPSGTQVSVRLNDAYSTKTAQLGTPVRAQLASDLVVDGRRVAKEGAALRGTITEVTSGSQKIGAVPALKIDFTELVVADGTTAAVNVRIAEKGASEKGRDTAKIVGGTAAGAVIGHQIDDDKGKIIGGIIGGAAGAVAAKKTGTELDLAAGSVVTATVNTAFEYRGK